MVIGSFGTATCTVGVQLVIKRPRAIIAVVLSFSMSDSLGLVE